MILTIELLGVPRRRAGWTRTELEMPADHCTLEAVVERLCRDTPALQDQFAAKEGRLRHVLAQVNEERFIHSVDEPLNDGDLILFLSADSGG